MSQLSKAVGIWKDEGPLSLLKKSPRIAYNRYVVPMLPRTTANYNGVSVNAAHYFDSVIPWRTKDRPHYESGLISGLEGYVDCGDDVVIVGGGWGVTAVKAAQKTGTTGQVTVYEGSAKELEYIRETAKKNNLSERIKVVHSVVGPEVSLRGETGAADQISADNLPECDVLELDCEGSEIEILSQLAIRPKVILVESHGMYNASSSKIEDLLKGMSYTIDKKVIADKGLKYTCEENDVYVLVAVRS